MILVWLPFLGKSNTAESNSVPLVSPSRLGAVTFGFRALLSSDLTTYFRLTSQFRDLQVNCCQFRLCSAHASRLRCCIFRISRQRSIARSRYLPYCGGGHILAFLQYCSAVYFGNRKNVDKTFLSRNHQYPQALRFIAQVEVRQSRLLCVLCQWFFQKHLK